MAGSFGIFPTDPSGVNKSRSAMNIKGSGTGFWPKTIADHKRTAAIDQISSTAVPQDSAYSPKEGHEPFDKIIPARTKSASKLDFLPN
jgi:hypothetical protein